MAAHVRAKIVVLNFSEKTNATVLGPHRPTGPPHCGVSSYATGPNENGRALRPMPYLVFIASAATVCFLELKEGGNVNLH